MWTNLSSLAQKAKQAAAIIEEQINDSIGVKEEGSGNGGEATDAHRGSDGGWDKCDAASSDGDEDEKVVVKQPDMPQEMSFVDLKSAAEEIIPKNDAGGLESNAALLDALARIEALEKQVNSLKDELVTVREESENYHATNLLLEQQVKELQEENSSLKGAGENE